MCYITLHFQAPLQSWGESEEWYKTRGTESIPTKSALAGLISRAMGLWEEETDAIQAIYNSIEGIRLHSENFRIPRRITDDQTIYIGDYLEQGLAKGLPAANGGLKYVGGIVRSQQMTKDYLEDTGIDIDLYGSKDFLSKTLDALQHPEYPLYFGRYCCLPAAGIVQDPTIHGKEGE